jgi:hypothetical protein
MLMIANILQDVYQELAQRPLQERIWLLDVDSEQSIYTSLSLVVLFASALAMALVGGLRASNGRRDAALWQLLGLGFVGLSLDEAVGLHEKLNPLIAAIRPTGILPHAWVIPGAAGCVAILLLFIPFLRRMPVAIARSLVGAGILFVAGAIGMEILSGVIVGDPDQLSPTYRALCAVEESLELAGALWCLYLVSRNMDVLAEY